MEITAKDLRSKTKQALETVARGQEVIITYRGKPRAKLVPVGTASTHDRADTPLFGMWHDHSGTEDVAAYLEHMRRSRF
jgi:prevent-host-death family protein